MSDNLPELFMSWINGWLALIIAIIFEGAATICLKYSDGFQAEWYWTFSTIVGYVVAFIFLSFSLQSIALGKKALMTSLGVKWPHLITSLTSL